jgi:hypothetical protein
MTQSRTMSFAFRWLAIAVVAGAFVFQTSTAKATPFTPYFDDLIVELQSRSAALSNSTDKVQIKQKKAVDKCLKLLVDKTSTSLATDLKNVGKVAKTLAKAFPEEFNPPVTTASAITIVSLSDLLNSAYSGFYTDVANLLEEIQTALATLPASSCKTAALAIVDDIQTLLDEAAAAPDLATAVKTLSKGLKTIAKADAAALKAADCNTGGSGGGNAKGLSCSVNGNSFSALGAAGVFLNITQQLTITGATAEKAVTVVVFGATGPGTYPIGDGSQVQLVSTFDTWADNATGTVTFTTLDIPAGKAVGTFEFTVTKTFPVSDSSNTVTVTNGKINISSIFSGMP